jgi:hypothetical protein
MIDSKADGGILSTNRIKWQAMIYKGSNEVNIEEVLADIGIQDIIE